MIVLALTLVAGCLTLDDCLDRRDATESELGRIYRSITALQHPNWPLTSPPRTLIRQTQNGTSFSLAVDAWELGEGWIDPTGLIWGDVLRDPIGRVRYLGQRDGARQCKLLRARLPSVEELKRLSAAMIIKCPWCEGQRAYQAQVLPHLRDNAMWSSTVLEDDDAYKDRLAWVFHPTDGRVYYADRGYRNPIRCVRQSP